MLCRGHYEQCRLSIRAFCSIVFYVAIVNWKIKVCIIIIIIIIWGPDGNSNECSWLQFADDDVVVSSSVRDSQTLIDIFAAWCAWAGIGYKAGHVLHVRSGKTQRRVYTIRTAAAHQLATCSSSIHQRICHLFGEDFRFRDEERQGKKGVD